jgi:hypothetical protein
VNVLYFFLWIQVEVVMLFFFNRGFGQDCPFLRLVCWVVWQWMLFFPVWQLGGGRGGVSALGAWAQAYLVGWGLWSRQVSEVVLWGLNKWARASLWVRNELFSWWDFQFQLAPDFSKQYSAWLSPRGCWVTPTPTWAFSALCSAPSPQAEGKYSLCVFGNQFCPEGVH